MATYHVATTGNNGNDGSLSFPWLTIQYGVEQLGAGDILEVHGGTYSPTGLIGVEINGLASGTSSNHITVRNYQSETVIIDCIGVNSNGTHYGIYVDGVSYWDFKGLHVKNVWEYNSGAEYGIGWQTFECSNINIEQCSVYDSACGFFDNYSDEVHYLNCDGYDTADRHDNGGLANGFTAHTHGTNVITYEGCRAWGNSDDGFDLYGSSGYITLNKCWAFANGWGNVNNGNQNGNGSGIKVGANDTLLESGVQRTITNCLAWGNRGAGLDKSQDNGPAMICHWYNNVSYQNAQAHLFFSGSWSQGPSADEIINNICYDNGAFYGISGSYTLSNNNFDTSDENGLITVTDADFISVSDAGADGARQSNGNLPLLDFLHLDTGSGLIAQGLDLDLPEDGNGNAWDADNPSIGAFEYNASPPTGNVPTLTTTAITSITKISAASGGDITDEGSAAVTARGVCWSLSPNPSTADSKTTDGSGIGSFSSALTGLTANRIYYVRAYATNSEGTAYGNEVSFETLHTTPTVSTTAVTSITVSSAVSGGNVTLQGGENVTAKGVCWSTSANPTIANSKTNDGTGLGSYVSQITGLTVNTTYYVRAYATNIEGTSYGANISFTTTAITVPVSSVTVTGAGGATSITVDDGTLQMIATVLPNNATDKSVVWSVVPGTGTASISATGLLTALTDGTVTVIATPNG